MQNMNKEILHRKLKNFGILILVGVAYYIWIRVTGLGIPCMTRRLTGFKCPGCGATTMVLYMAKLNFARAYRANPFLFSTLPFLMLEFFYVNILEIYEKKSPMWNNVILILFLIAFIGFGVLRNF